MNHLLKKLFRKKNTQTDKTQNRISKLAIIITIFTGIFYIVNSLYVVTEYYPSGRGFRNVGGVIMVGLSISTIGVGFIASRPFKQQNISACFLFIIFAVISLYQFYFFRK